MLVRHVQDARDSFEIHKYGRSGAIWGQLPTGS